MMIIILLVIAVITTWFIAGFGVVRENERVITIQLGQTREVKNSGIFWIPFLIAWVRRYPTKVVELTIARRDADWKVVRDENGRPVPAGGFITVKKNDLGPVNVGVSLSFRFRWPEDFKHLAECVRLLPDPKNEKALTDLFQEIIMDETRSVGCTMTYLDLMQERKTFADGIREAMLKGYASQLLVETGLSKEARVIVDHIDIPQETIDAIDDEEAQRLQAEGVRRKAEGEKDRIKLLGEGQAEAIAKLKEKGEKALQYEALRTLREMAQGPSSTIFVPLGEIGELVSKLTKKFTGR